MICRLKTLLNALVHHQTCLRSDRPPNIFTSSQHFDFAWRTQGTLQATIQYIHKKVYKILRYSLQ